MTSSWFPFPFNISLSALVPPLSIQRRFISFILKRSLGHLLKPGQFDLQQIDAQIGNGFVEVKDLQLDADAIDKYLVGLPVRLQEGIIGTVKVRIPWPNPFTSTIGLSISDVELTLFLTEENPHLQANVDASSLAESVASVAETFIHNELTDREEELLRDSFHPGVAHHTRSREGGENVPGSMDPFLVQDNETPTQDAPLESDPEGVSIFAGLIERLLARFDFETKRIRVTLVRPESCAISLCVDEFVYFTDSTKVAVNEAHSSKDMSVGETRTAKILGINVSISHLEPPHVASPVQGTTPIPTRPCTPTSNDSDSELDDETQLMMSQSLASLPPRPTIGRPASPSLSTVSSSSSMYHSIASGGEEGLPNPPSEVDDSPIVTKPLTILSINDGIAIHLTTPSPVLYPNLSAMEEPILAKDVDQAATPGNSVDNIRVEINVGLVSAVLRSADVRGILSILPSVSSPVDHRIPIPAAEKGKGKMVARSSFLEQLDMHLHSKGFVGIVSHHEGDVDAESIGKRFFHSPLVAPRMPCGYVRLHIQDVRVINASSTCSSGSSKVNCTVKDLSVIAFHPHSSSLSKNRASPILVTDPFLDLSYSYDGEGRSAHDHSHPKSEKEKQSTPALMDVFDWTDESAQHYGTSLRPWRTKNHSLNPRRSPRQGGSSELPSSQRTFYGSPPSPGFMPSSPTSPRPIPPSGTSKRQMDALIMDLTLKGDQVGDIVIGTAPLHLFVDVSLVPMLLTILDQCLPVQSGNSRKSSEFIAEKRGAKLVEKQALEELSLAYDYRDHFSPREDTSETSRQHSSALLQGARESPGLRMSVPLLRIQIRVPSPLRYQQRSGSLVLDLHTVRVGFNQPKLLDHAATRFEAYPGSDFRTSVRSWYKDLGDGVKIAASSRRIVVAYAAPLKSHAEACLSLGPIEDLDVPPADLHAEMTLLPFVAIGLQNPGKGPRGSNVPDTKLLLSLPSVHVSITKHLFDGLQLWADDVAQWVDKCFSDAGKEYRSKIGNAGFSRESSLIGSRFFVSAGSSRSGSGENVANTPRSETVIKAFVSKAFIRLYIPIHDSDARDQTVDVSASDMDALMELKPEGREETIVTLGIADVFAVTTRRGVARTLVNTNPQIKVDHPNSVIKLRFRSISVPETLAKQSKIKLGVNSLHFYVHSELEWISDLADFLKAPPGVFESVVPSEKTEITLSVLNSAVLVVAPNGCSALVLSLSDVEGATELLSDAIESIASLVIIRLSVLIADELDESQVVHEVPAKLGEGSDTVFWTTKGFALLTCITDLKLQIKQTCGEPRELQVLIDDADISMSLCADTIAGIAKFAASMQSLTQREAGPSMPKAAKRPTTVSESVSSSLTYSLDEQAFRRAPVIGPLPDMISDDLPTNPEYLDSSFGAAAGLRELDDEDLDDFYPESANMKEDDTGVLRYGGETIKMLHPHLNVIEHFYDTLPAIAASEASEYGPTSLKVRAKHCNLRLLLYDGYDWARTRKAIQDEVKNMKKKLAKIRQLLATGQAYDPNFDEVNTVLFNSVYIGLEEDVEGLESAAIIAAIDKELDEDDDASSDSSWQSFKPGGAPIIGKRDILKQSKNLTRRKGPSIEIVLSDLNAEFDQYLPGSTAASRVLFTIRDLEILDHIKTSTWSKFLTQLRTDFKGNIRETESNMVKVELLMLLPYPGHSEEEARLKAKILPLRLHVDQDALDFLKKFFSFKDPDAVPSPPPENEIFFQHAEVFPVDIKLDYKPRRVDYRALREGRTIELMNFFHFDGAEMTLRHITLKGITGWPRFFDSLNDLWTPDVKANQLVDVISGVSPIRSAVNVGSGVADLVLLPIAQYKKDGRVIRGLQKGGKAFVKSTAMEALKLGAQLATGTQVILEQAEDILGGTDIGSVTAEALQTSPLMSAGDLEDDGEEPISKYAEQPTNVREGFQSAYKTLARNLKSAGQTILAVPMEVYERSGSEGPARAVIRAVPIAVLKPMIGASEAVSKTLLGIRNTLDPSNQLDTEAKYKQR